MDDRCERPQRGWTVTIAVAYVFGLAMCVAAHVFDGDKSPGGTAETSPAKAVDERGIVLGEHQTRTLDDSGLVVHLSESTDVVIEPWIPEEDEPDPVEYSLGADALGVPASPVPSP